MGEAWASSQVSWAEERTLVPHRLNTLVCTLFITASYLIVKGFVWVKAYSTASLSRLLSLDISQLTYAWTCIIKTRSVNCYYRQCAYRGLPLRQY